MARDTKRNKEDHGCTAMAMFVRIVRCLFLR